MIGASIVEIAAALKARRLSSVELTREVLDRIGRLNPVLNAFITVDPERALADAAAADAAIADGTGGPLTGIPIAHKDILATAGMRTTCGSRMLANYTSPYDAHVVEGLARAGTVLVGKTNMDEFAMGSSSETSHFGPVRNPWNVALRPRWKLRRLGGRGRRPAGPGGHRHRHRGLDPPAGRAVRHLRIEADIRHLLALRARRVRVEPRPGGPVRADRAGPRAAAQCDGRPRSARLDLARPRRRGLYAPPRPRRRRETARRTHASGCPANTSATASTPTSRGPSTRRSRELRALGATTVDVTLPNARLSVPVYYVIAPAEASSNLSRFDGVRYGHRAATYDDLTDMYRKSRAEGFGAEVKRRILVGTYVLSHGYYDAYYLKAQQVRHLIADDFRRAYRDLRRDHGSDGADGRLSDRRQGRRPGADVPQRHLHRRGQPDRRAGACRFPAASTGNGLPIGLQIQGDYFTEATMLDVAHRFQQATDWHRGAPSQPVDATAWRRTRASRRRTPDAPDQECT